MPITVTCSCKRRGVVPDNCAGLRVRCKACGRRLVVPPAPPAAEAAPAPPAPGVAPTPPAWRGRGRRTAAAAGVVVVLLLLLGAGVALSGRGGAVPAPGPEPEPPQLAVAPEVPEESESLTMNATVEIDRVGDARFKAVLRLPTNVYTVFKAETPNIALALRRIGLSKRHWRKVQEVQGSFEDGTSTVSLGWLVRGLARPEGDTKWVADLEDEEGAKLMTIERNRAIFSTATSSPLGVLTAKTNVVLPAESREVSWSAGARRLAYQIPGPRAAGSRAGVAFDLEAKPQVLGCLAKCYGNARRFPELWAARALLKNTGEEVLRDYRVRFRLGDYTKADWGPWQECPVVVPGQTVLDAYFPILDTKRVATLEGTTPARLEVEYQSRTRPDHVAQRTAVRVRSARECRSPGVLRRETGVHAPVALADCGSSGMALP